MNNRIRSIDVLRGFDMIWIMGLETVFVLIGNNSDSYILKWIANQMHHAEWDGFHFMDLVFPLFLFIAGVSFYFSSEKRISAENYSSAALYKHIIKRTLLLVFFGMIYNGFLNFDFQNTRYASVLGHIGIAWGIAAVIFLNVRKLSSRIILLCGLLIGYWLILALAIPPDAPANAARFSMEGSVVGYIDRMFLPGRLYKIIHDPEGILTIIPSVATALFGMLTGFFLGNKNISPQKKTLYLIIAGFLCLIDGLFWDIVLPINKNLWTGSFVMFSVGWSLLLLSLFYFIFDVKQWCKNEKFFSVIGMNCLFIYLIQAIVPFERIATFFLGGICKYLPDYEKLIISIGYIAACWLVLYFLYKKKVFIKI